MRPRVNVALFSVFAILPLVRLSADTLFKNTAAVALGFGDDQKHGIQWTDCSRKAHTGYVKPPYWIDKSDNCHISASAFGLHGSGKNYVAKDTEKAAKFFPDIKKNDEVKFEDIPAEQSVILTFKDRSLHLTYTGLPSGEAILSNQLSVAVGLAVVGRREQAIDLLESADGTITENAANGVRFADAVFAAGSADLLAISTSSPALSDHSHGTWLRLAQYRSALEELPPVGFSPHGKIVVSGGPQLIGGDFFDFGSSREDNIVLKRGPDGRMPYHILAKGSMFQGGAQLLDGIYWDNVTFVRTRIRYSGGKVFLRRINFVKCSFDVVNDPAGNRFLDFATRGLPQLFVGTENDLPPDP